MFLYSYDTIKIAFIVSARLAGIKNPNQFFNENKVFLDQVLMPYAKTEQESLSPTAENRWSEKIASTFTENLTHLQREILNIIHRNDNRISLGQLIKDLNKGDFGIVKGQTLAGSLAGLSRKCDSLKVSYIYDAKKNGNDWIYFICEEPYSFFKKILDQDKFK